MSPAARVTTVALSLMLVTCALPADDPLEAPSAEQDEASLPRSPLDPRSPLEVGAVPDGASAAQVAALWWVNTFRMRAGLGPLDELENLNTAAAAHAKYVLVNPDVYEQLGLSVHEELEGRDGFFARRFWERMALAGYGGKPFREVIAYQAHPAAAVAHWIETVYHRLPILHPSAKHLGYAEAHLGGARINVVDIGAGNGLGPTILQGIAWPPDGAVNVPVAWDGLESPQPPAPPGGYPSGPVVSLTFEDGAAVVVSEHAFRRAGGGADLPHVLLTADNDPVLAGESSVALYTHAPLEGGVAYEVSVAGTAGGVLFHRLWTFTTRPSTACSLIAQDCGVGKACYGKTDGDAVCAWSGALREGSACEFQNDCEAGLTCVAGVCRWYCRILPGGTGACEQCEAGHTPISNADALGACKVP